MPNELDADKKRKVINKVVQKLSDENPNFYYTNSSEIANLVKEEFDNNNLNKDELDLVKDLSAEDIHILLSFKNM